MPDFSLAAADGSTVSLNQLKGKKVVLYFYPKDNTPACSAQAKAFSDASKEISELGTVILGISRDSISSHVKFIAKLNLPFLLLSDPNEVVCQLYNVIKGKNMYGKKVRGIERSTFIINEQGILIHEFRKVKVAVHIGEVLSVLKKLS
ncbi:putative peroxiredoxin bcp [bioreactor metagenome]|uniref:thioredoxin-dependent peroxiredoxin n=1 Tax=bioreactor metagenome TaxID=1076179 RepID=A0A645JIG4_9ZZZZ